MQSVIAGNTFVVTRDLGGLITLGNNSPTYGRERVLIHNGRIFADVPTVGPLLVFRSLTVPSLVSDLIVYGLARVPDGGQRDVDYQDGTTRTMVTLRNIVATFDWYIFDRVAGTHTLVPAGAWSD